jgi:hypothetical protein
MEKLKTVAIALLAFAAIRIFGLLAIAIIVLAYLWYRYLVGDE